jgi:hypothetical protein
MSDGQPVDRRAGPLACRPPFQSEDLMADKERVYSTMVRAGRTTYFVDVREAKNGNRYLSIAESRIDDDDKRQRTTVRVFGESVEQFKQAVDEAAAAVNGGRN